MPYVKDSVRDRLDDNGDAHSVGELNYQITRLCDIYTSNHGRSYTAVNDVIGVLECAKQEYYRRIAAPYENEKIADNGDVYSADNLPAVGNFVTLPDALATQHAEDDGCRTCPRC